MDENTRIKLSSEMQPLFESGAISSCSSEDLQKYLAALCSGRLINIQVHPRDVVRGITINHIQMARVISKLESTIEKLNAENAKKDRWIMILAIASLVATIVGMLK